METKMSLRDFAVVFLIWGPLGVNAICPAPTLDHGYFLPDKKQYAENEVLFYACDSEFKPDLDEWWGATTCTDDRWSTVPKCIAKDHCIGPNIANGDIQVRRAVHPPGEIILIHCDEGYHSENPQPVCSDGTWTPHPICKENECGDIPQIPNGAGQVQGRVVKYACSTGYVLAGARTVHCLSNGRWSDPPACAARRVGTGQVDPHTRGAAGRGDETIVSLPRQEASIEHCGAVPRVPNAVHEEFAWNVLYTCVRGYQMKTTQSRIYCYTDGLWSTPLPECIVRSWHYHY